MVTKPPIQKIVKQNHRKNVLEETNTTHISRASTLFNHTSYTVQKVAKELFFILLSSNGWTPNPFPLANSGCGKLQSEGKKS
jgi:hypothetical protein